MDEVKVETTEAPKAEPEKVIPRDDKGHFLPGHGGIPGAGRPKEISITELIKRELKKVPEGQQMSYAEAFVKKILKKAIMDDDGPTQKLLWNYVDGLPKANFGLEVDKESLAELTQFLREVANQKQKDDGTGSTGV